MGYTTHAVSIHKREGAKTVSYSFTITAKDKAEAKEKVAAELANVLAFQPAHKKDEPAAKAAAEAFIDLLTDSPDHHISVSVHGSVGWVYDGTDGSDSALTSASVGVSAWHVPAKAHAADELDTSV